MRKAVWVHKMPLLQAAPPRHILYATIRRPEQQVGTVKPKNTLNNFVSDYAVTISGQKTDPRTFKDSYSFKDSY